MLPGTYFEVTENVLHLCCAKHVNDLKLSKQQQQKLSIRMDTIVVQ